MTQTVSNTKPQTTAEILANLKKSKIPFCIWKNAHQHQDMLRGDTDVDIHIPLSAKLQFQDFCIQHGGIEVLSPHSNFPAVSHVLFPGVGPKVLHLHVYFEIFTGESHLKDYYFPISDLLIETRKPDKELGFVADPNLLRIIYVLRHYLKKSSLLGLIFHFRERADYTAERANLPDLITSTEGINFLPAPYLLELDGRMERAGAIETWLKGKGLRRRMRGLKRMSWGQAVLKSLRVMTDRVLNRLFYKETKSLMGLGRFTAITGLDGSGKTTLLDIMARSLGKKITVHKVHLGRPSATLLTFPLRGALWLRKSFGKSSDEDNESSDMSSKPVGMISALRYAGLAYERNKLGRKILKWISKGHIVLSDRFPSKSLGKMDSPRIGTQHKSSFICVLGKIEHNLYATLPMPDLLFEISVSLETAQKRNAAREKADKETVEELADRYAKNSNLEYSAKKHIKFVNELTLDEATEKLFGLIWEHSVR